MVVIRYPGDQRPGRWPASVLALGNFDGLHRGHLKILDRVRRRADERVSVAVAVTFEPHPPRVLRPDKAPPLLMTMEQKVEALARSGMDAVGIVPFTPELSRWEPEEFVKKVLVDWLRAAEVWVGANFLFGHDRSGNFSVLRALGARFGFRTEKIDPVRYKEFVVSSTRVRRLIAEGRVDEASALLGHHYAIDGEVVRGVGRGREVGFPTANLRTENELVPPHGVYATLATIDAVVHASVTNIGVRPTFGDSSETIIETHVLGLSRDLGGQRIRLAFVLRLRDERRFESVEALRTQIQADCRQARDLFARISL